MSSREQSFRAGETKGRTQEKANQTMESMGQKVQDVKEKSQNAAQGVREKAQDKGRGANERGWETAQSGKDNSEGFMQQAGEKVRGMADSVKNTFGMDHNDENPPRNY
ncbi:hypothetical protein K1719_021614 [Acacia pycnantha]|nr:hypothetical protein K1719_021428 [Acacia pycnantha]KAI9107577.1 hypothetical protein K1719_021614 [Acacia pycnantha]